MCKLDLVRTTIGCLTSTTKARYCQSIFIAGYVRSQGGKEWVVVFFINHPNAKYGQAAQDALVEWVQGR